MKPILVTGGAGYIGSHVARQLAERGERVIFLGDGVPVGQRGGEMIFNKVCIQCHAADSKTLNSPKLNNTAEWAPRIAQGFDTLFVHARDGFKNNTMPARGGMTADTLTDDELKRAIAYMANSAGAKFTEPPIVNASETAATASK